MGADRFEPLTALGLQLDMLAVTSEANSETGARGWPRGRASGQCP